jgi:hypothetical protein
MQDDFDDSLDDIIGGAPRTAPKPEFKTRLERAEERQVFTERCPACGGSGRWRGFRQCFKCEGKGVLTFKTSHASRANAKMKREEKAELKAETDAQWRADHTVEINWLRATAQRQEARATPWAFPGELLQKLEQYGTLTEGQLGAVHKCMLRDAERQQARDQARPEMDCSKITASFAKARAAAAADGENIWGLRLRLGEFVFSPDRADPDAVWIKGGGAGDAWRGKIVAGRFHRFKACTDEHEEKIATVCADPSSAARAFGQRWKSCSCCGRTLTNEDSRAAGIGPICAERWGL